MLKNRSELFFSRPLKHLPGLKTLPLAMLLSACAGSESAEEHYQKALQYLEQGKQKAAVIELKSSLQQDKQFFDARQALGDIYFKQGDFLSAIKEYRLVLAAGKANDQLLIRLTEANLLLGQNESIPSGLEFSSQLEATLSALESINTSIDPTSSQAQANLASTSTDASPYQLLAQAYYWLKQGNHEQAEKIAALIPATLESPLLSILHGRIQIAKGDLDAAIQTYQQLAAASPKQPRYQLLLAYLLTETNQFARAETLIDPLLKLNKNHPTINIIKAQIRLEAKDYANAQQHAEVTLATAADNQLAHLIAGYAAYSQNKIEQAYNHLSPLSGKLDPTSVAARILVDLQLKLGFVDKASQLASSTSIQDDPNFSMLQYTATKLVEAGHTEEARSIVARAHSKAQDDENIEVLLGRLELLSGETGGIKRLQQALNNNKELIPARIALAHYFIREGKYDQAQKIADDWVSTSPQKSPGHLLLGLLSNAQQQYPQAETSFQTALALTPDNLSAKLGLVDALLGQKAYAKAAQALLELVPDKASHPGVFQRLIHLAEAANNSPSLSINPILARLTQGIKATSNLNARDKLITTQATLLSITGDRTTAIRLLTETQGSQSPGQLLLLGDLLIAEGERTQAKDAYDKGLKLYPANTALRLRQVGILSGSGKREEAIDSVQEGLKLTPQSPYLALIAANLYYDSGQLAQARSVLGTQSRAALEGITAYWKMVGLLDLAAGDGSTGIAALKTYFERSNSINAAELYATALEAYQQIDSAIQFLRNLPPADSTQALLARIYSGNGQAPQAARIYESILNRNPRHVVSLNNLALYLQGQGQLQRALELAKRAVEVAPQQPAILDTYGSILLSAGRFKEALPPLQNAYDKAPTVTAIAQNYALALQQNGMESKAEQVRAAISAQ